MPRRPMLILLASAALAGGATLGAGCGGDESAEITPIPTETMTGTTEPATTATTPTATSSTPTIATVTAPSATTATPDPSTATAPAAPTTTPDPGATGGAAVTEPNGGTPARSGADGGSAPADPGSAGGAGAPQQDPDCKPGTGPGFPDRPQCEPVSGPDAREDEG